jgi:peptidoglycan/xylan/chitin deacetylase (PgdA/CDA1 family)
MVVDCGGFQSLIQTIFERPENIRHKNILRAFCLMYHDVVPLEEPDASGFPGISAARYKLEPGTLQMHLSAIKACTSDAPVSVLDMLAGTARTFPFLLTFDDGGVSACMTIADILEKFGWVAHFFVATDLIDRPKFITGQQARQLRAKGHILGSHSRTHPTRMSACPWEVLVSEWRTSISILSDLLGEPVTVASIPGGYYSTEVARAASSAGIQALFTSEPTSRCHSVGQSLVIGRYTMMRHTTASTAAAIASGKAIPRWNQWLFWNCKKLTKLVGGEHYVKMTEIVLGKCSKDLRR